MEKRAILAAILMAALLIAYQALFTPAPEAPAPAKTTQAPAAPAQAPVPAAAPQPVDPAPASSPPPAVPERSLVIETPLYRAVLSSNGGAFREWVVNFKGQRPMVVPGILGPRGVVVERAGSAPHVVAFTLPADPVKLGPTAPTGQVTMVGEDGFGLRITRTLGFRADTYIVDQQIKVENRQAVPQQAQIALEWMAPAEWPKEAHDYAGPRPIHIVRLGPGEFWAHREYLANAGNFVGDGRWIGIESGLATSSGVIQPNGVYLTALVPKSPDLKVTETSVADPTDAKKPPKEVRIGLRVALPVLGPGQSWEGRGLTYVGPMEYDRLKSLEVGLEKSIYFGGFPFPESWASKYGLPALPMEWIALPILWLMHWFHSFTGNYGVAIILLTVIFKVLFFPLTVKSMKSMKAMQVIQPQVNALRAKYKSEPQKVQQETMELYRKHGVNPLGGCLPMVVQIPVFYALYVALAVSVELQKAPFLCFGRLFGMDLWICDLAEQDPTYVLPILMGVTMFIQQKMTPVMGDPRQAKMMLFMPVVFTFMFLNLPAGLVLYWTLSNVLQIAQQRYMNQESSKPDKAEKAPARAAKKA